MRLRGRSSCARDVSDGTSVVPPISIRKSRRLMSAPKLSSRYLSVNQPLGPNSTRQNNLWRCRANVADGSFSSELASAAVRPNARFAQKADSGADQGMWGPLSGPEYKSGVQARANRCSEMLVFESLLRLQAVSSRPHHHHNRTLLSLSLSDFAHLSWSRVGIEVSISFPGAACEQPPWTPIGGPLLSCRASPARDWRKSDVRARICMLGSERPITSGNRLH